MIKPNPFSKGCNKPTIKTLFCVISDDANIVQYLPIHPSQQSIELHLLEDSSGRYCDSYVFAYLEDIGIPDDVMDECDRLGSISHVVFQVEASNAAGQLINLGYFVTEEEAKAVVDSYSFTAGAASLCWSINCRHITVEAMFNLIETAQRLYPYDYQSTGLEIVPRKDNKLGGTFWGMVVMLKNAPWTEDDCREYQKEMEKWRFDSQFIEIILAAGSAGVSTLIFDDKAETLQGLPVSKVYLKDNISGDIELDHYWRTHSRLWNRDYSHYTPLDKFSIYTLPATEEDYLAQDHILV